MEKPPSLLTRPISLLKSEMGRTLLRTFIARAIAALGALALAVVIGRLYGPVGVGVYALAYGLLLGFAIFARGGMDNALMRYVGQEHDSPLVLRYLRKAVQKSMTISLVYALILWLFRFQIEAFFEAEGLASVLNGIVLALPAFTFGFLLSGFFKGIRMPATACLLENGSVALVAGALILFWSNSGYGLASIGYAYALASWLIAIQGVIQLWLWARRQSWWHQTSLSTAELSFAEFTSVSRSFFVMNLAGFMQTVLGVMIAGWLLSSAELGLFKSSQQTAFLISFILIVINAVFPPRFATLYRQGNIVALGRLARQGALLGIVISAPLLLVCLFFPGWVLSMFGEEFRPAALLLQIIAVAQLVNVATGSVGFLLNMTGHEKLMRNIALLCNLLGLLGFLALIPVYGAMGAALALAFVLVAQNLLALYFVWKRLGIWMLPTPNILQLAGVQPD